MRRRLFDWHLKLGLIGGILVLVWSVSGALMILDPVLRRGLDSLPPGMKTQPLDPAAFSFPAARLPAEGAAGLALRTFGGRSWYEARFEDGRAACYAASDGSAVPCELGAGEAAAALAGRLAGTGWSVASFVRLAGHDDHYRSGELPVFLARLEGPSAPWLYLSVRDGSGLKTVTRAARALRWLGLGIHTWNTAAFKKSADDLRRWSLALAISLPLAVLAAVGLALLGLRSAAVPKVPARRRAPGRAASVIAALSSVLLVLASPGEAAVTAAAAVSAGRMLGVAPVISARPSLSLPLPAPTLPLPTPALSAALPVPVLPVVGTPAVARPVKAVPSALAMRATAVLAPALAEPGKTPSADGRAERALGLVFDGGSRKTGSDSGVVAASAGHSRPLLTAPNGVLPRRGQAEPSAPSARQPDRKALWGIYVTHGAHLLTMSAAWRVAWPLLAIELIGKGGLAAVGSFGALVSMGTGLAAGVLVDRLLPRRSMAAAAVLRAAIGAGVAGVAALGVGSVPLLLGFSIAHAFALTTIHIGQSTAAPEAAGDVPGGLTRVNAALKVITAAVSIPGALAGGVLAASFGASGVLLGYAAANLLLLAPLYLWLLAGRSPAVPAFMGDMRKAGLPKGAPAPAPKGGLWEAARLVATSRVLMASLAAMAAGVLMVEPLRSVTLPILAGELDAGAAALMLGGFQAAYSSGQLAANLALMKWSARLPERAWLWLGAAGLASFGLFALAPAWVGFAFLATALVGLLTQPLSVSAKTLFQSEVKRLRPDLLGRAMGLNNIAYRLAVSAGTALVGWAAVTGGAWGLGATATLAAVYGVLAVLLVGAVNGLLRQPAAERKSEAQTRRLGGFAPLALLGLSALDWHMTLGAFTGALMVYMAVTGAVTVLTPLIKKRFEAKLPKAAPPPAPPPPISPEEALAKAESWLARSRWRPAGLPELLKKHDELYKSGELPVYRLGLEGPGGFIAYLSARDGRAVLTSSRLARALRFAGLALHTFGFGLLKSRYDAARRLAIPLAVALPIVLTILAAMLSRWL